MFFWKRQKNNSNQKLVEIIKNELIITLQKKGLKIAQIDIDMQSGSMNLHVLIDEKA